VVVPPVAHSSVVAVDATVSWLSEATIGVGATIDADMGLRLEDAFVVLQVGVVPLLDYWVR
jgi:hypothetical protein